MTLERTLRVIPDFSSSFPGPFFLGDGARKRSWERGWPHPCCATRLFQSCFVLAAVALQALIHSHVPLGDVKTFQRGDLARHGMLFKIVPKYSYKSHKHYTGCWKRYGSKSRKVKAQGILPCNVVWPFRSRTEDFKVNRLSPRSSWPLVDSRPLVKRIVGSRKNIVNDSEGSNNY